MGKRSAEEELFKGNMGSIQWEDSALYTTRGTASPVNVNKFETPGFNI